MKQRPSKGWPAHYAELVTSVTRCSSNNHQQTAIANWQRRKAITLSKFNETAVAYPKEVEYHQPFRGTGTSKS
jgi:hypothetical protein